MIPTGSAQLTPGRSADWSRSRVLFLAVSASAVIAFLWWANEVLLPFVLALIIAYVLAPLVAGCERRLRVPRAAAILLVYAFTIGSIYGSVAMVAPRVYEEAADFVREAPQLAQRLSLQWGPPIEKWLEGLVQRSSKLSRAEEPRAAIEVTRRLDGVIEVQVGTGLDIVQREPGHWRVGSVTRPVDRFDVGELVDQGIAEGMSYLKRNALELILIGHTVVRAVARSIFLVFMTLMVAGYLILTRENVYEFFRSLVPLRARASYDLLAWRIDRGLAGVVRGQLLICLVNGMLSAIGFWLFGLKYWPILSIVAGIMSLIPIFGSILSSIPAVLIGLTQGFWTALWVLLWILGIHQIEANLLNPKIIGVIAKIHPVLVVFVLLAGEHYFGLWGALLAVPTWSLLQSIFNHFRFQTLPDSPPDSLVPPPTRTPMSRRA